MDTRVFDTLVPPDHSRRRVTRRLDCERWRDLITDGYRPAMGRTAADPMRVITLAVLPCHDTGVCVAMERKTGTFMLIILFVGIPERTQTTLSNGL
jgi:hypothetical protein